MQTLQTTIGPTLRGRIGLWDIDERTGLATFRHCKPNQIQTSWGVIAAHQIGFRQQAGRLSYAISAMYIEFENVPDPEDAASIPDFSADEGLDYYDGLLGSGVRDFLRVPLRMEPTLTVAAGYENRLPADEGNVLTFFAQTSGVEGVHGKTFSDSVNSKICGAALVATPVFADRTRDIVFARTYFEVADQTLKLPSSQAGLTWEISFTPA